MGITKKTCLIKTKFSRKSSFCERRLVFFEKRETEDRTAEAEQKYQEALETSTSVRDSMLGLMGAEMTETSPTDQKFEELMANPEQEEVFNELINENFIELSNEQVIRMLEAYQGDEKFKTISSKIAENFTNYYISISVIAKIISLKPEAEETVALLNSLEQKQRAQLLNQDIPESVKDKIYEELLDKGLNKLDQATLHEIIKYGLNDIKVFGELAKNLDKKTIRKLSNETVFMIFKKAAEVTDKTFLESMVKKLGKTRRKEVATHMLEESGYTIEDGKTVVFDSGDSRRSFRFREEQFVSKTLFPEIIAGIVNGQDVPTVVKLIPLKYLQGVITDDGSVLGNKHNVEDYIGSNIAMVNTIGELERELGIAETAHEWLKSVVGALPEISKVKGDEVEKIQGLITEEALAETAETGKIPDTIASEVGSLKVPDEVKTGLTSYITAVAIPAETVTETAAAEEERAPTPGDTADEPAPPVLPGEEEIIAGDTGGEAADEGTIDEETGKPIDTETTTEETTYSAEVTQGIPLTNLKGNHVLVQQIVDAGLEGYDIQGKSYTASPDHHMIELKSGTTFKELWEFETEDGIVTLTKQEADSQSRKTFERGATGQDLIDTFKSWAAQIKPKDLPIRKVESYESAQVKSEKADEVQYARIDENNNILDLNEHYDLGDPHLMDFSKEKFINEWDNFSGSEIIAAEFAKINNIHKESAPGRIRDLINRGAMVLDDGYISLDLVLPMSADEFQAAYKEAIASGDTKSQEALYNMYISAKRVMEGLRTTTYSPTTTQSSVEKYSYQFKRAEEIKEANDMPVSGYFELPNGKLPGIKFAHSQKAHDQFTDIYRDYMGMGNSESVSINSAHMIEKVLMMYDYHVEDLVSQGVLKTENPGSPNLVLVKIPDGIVGLTKDTSKKAHLKPFFERVNEDMLAEEPMAIELDALSAAEQQQEMIKLIQRDLMTSEGIENAIIDQFETHTENSTEEQIEWSRFNNYLSQSENPTLRSIDYQEMHDLLNDTFGREFIDAVVVKQLLDRPTVKIEHADGSTETLYIYTLTGYGNKIYNMEDIDKYFEHLIELGKKQEKIERLHRERDYDPKTALDKTIEAPSENELLKAFQDATTANDIKKAWKEIPGYEDINELLGGAPLNLSTINDVPRMMHELLKGKKEITFQDVIENVYIYGLKPKLEQMYPTATVSYDTFENIKTAYNHTLNRYFDLLEKEKDPEHPSDEFVEARRKYLELRQYTDSATSLMIRIQKLGTPIIPLGDLDVMNMSDSQMTLVKKGIMYKTKTEEIGQELEAMQNPLSKHEGVRMVQQQLRDNGFEGDVSIVEDVMLGGMGVVFDGAELIGGGLAFPAVDLGDGFKLLPHVSNAGVGAALMFTAYKDEDATISNIVDVGMGPFGPSLTVAVITDVHADEISPGANFQWAFTASLSALPAIALTVGYSYDSKRAQIIYYNEDRTTSGMQEIDAATDNLPKQAELLRTHPSFAEVQGDLDDSQLVHVYNTWKAMDSQRSLEDSVPPVISGVQLGLVVSPLGPGFIAVITFNLDSVYMVEASVRTKELFAQHSSDQAITDALYDEVTAHIRSVNSSPEAYQETGFREFHSSEFYMNENGDIGLLVEDSEQSFEIDEEFVSNLDDMREKLRSENEMDVDIVTIDINGEPKEVLELSFLNTDNKDLRVAIDERTRQDLNIILGPEGQIYIPGNTQTNLQGLIIASVEHNYHYQKTDRGAATVKTIILTNAESFAEHGYETERVIAEGGNYLVKEWNNGEHKSWKMVEGQNTGAIDRINNISRYQTQPGHATPMYGYGFEDFAESKDVMGPRMAELEDIANDTAHMREHFDPMSRDALMAQESITLGMAEKIYVDSLKDKLHDDPADGGIMIVDTNKIIEVANEHYERVWGRKLNEKQVGELLSYVNHQYYIDVWSRGDMDKIKKASKGHNEFIRKKVLVPSYKESMGRLNITPPEGMTIDEYAVKLSHFAIDKANENLAAEFAKIDSPAKLADIMMPMSELAGEHPGMLIGAGTSIRGMERGASGRGALNISVAGGSIEGIPAMGIIGEPQFYDLHSSNPYETDLARIQLETMSPRPNLEDLNTMYSPFAQKLAAFGGTRAYLGNDTFETLDRFYAASPEQKEALIADTNSAEYRAVNEFIDFYGTMVESLFDPESNGIISLDNGDHIEVVGHIGFANYAECTNFEELVDIDLKYHAGIPENEQAFFEAAGTEDSVGVKTITKMKNVEFSFGIAIFDSPDDQPPPPEEPGKKAEIDNSGLGMGKSGDQTGSTGAFGDPVN